MFEMFVRVFFCHACLVSGAGGSHPAAAQERAQLALGGEATVGLHAREARQSAGQRAAVAGPFPSAGGVLLLHRGEDGGGFGVPRQPEVGGRVAVYALS